MEVDHIDRSGCHLVSIRSVAAFVVEGGRAKQIVGDAFLLDLTGHEMNQIYKLMNPYRNIEGSYQLMSEELIIYFNLSRWTKYPEKPR